MEFLNNLNKTVHKFFVIEDKFGERLERKIWFK